MKADGHDDEHHISLAPSLAAKDAVLFSSFSSLYTVLSYER